MSGLAFLIDMDGVIHRGDAVIPEALVFLESVRHYPYLFFTNNSSETPEAVVEKLTALGVPDCCPGHILTSAIATADYLRDLTPDYSYYAVGGAGLHDALIKYGREDHEDPDYVVVGEGEGLDYDTLTTGISILFRGRAKLIGTNPDTSLDGTRAGRSVVLPGGGALVAPFQAATGMKPLFIGKPGPIMYQMGLSRLGKQAHEVFMIGDRPDTDIKGAAQLGIRTILVCTGRFRREDPYPPESPRPDLMVDSLSEVQLAALEAMVGAW
jgi:HAD superfamily hydrolase (TIGR01457 family)